MVFPIFLVVRRIVLAWSCTILIVAGIVAPATAQTESDVRACNASESASPSVTIPACSAIIASGSATQREAAFVNRGVAYSNSNACASAIRDFDRAIALNAHDANAFLDRGVCFAKLGDDERAIGDYGKSIALEPAAKPYRNRGLAYFRLQKYRDAERDFEAVTRLNPNDADAYVDLGLAREWEGRYAEAIRAADEGIRLDAADKDSALDIIAYSSRELHEYARSIEAANKILQLNARSNRAYFDLGYAYGELGDIDQALSDFDQALAIDPKDAGSLSQRCLYRAVENDLDRALGDCNAAVTSRPKVSVYRYRRAVAFYKRGRYAEAIADLDTYLRSERSTSYGYVLRALAERKIGKRDAAQRDGTTAARLHKTDLVTLGIRGDGSTFAVPSRPYERPTVATQTAADPSRPSWASLNVSKNYGGDAVSQIRFPDGQVLTATRGVTVGAWSVSASKPTIQIYDMGSATDVKLVVLNLNCTYESTTQECKLFFDHDDSGTLTDYSGNRVSSFCSLTVGGLSDALKLYNAPCPTLLALAGSDKPTWADLKLAGATALRSIHFFDGQTASTLSSALLGSYTVKLTQESTIEPASYGGVNVHHISCTNASGKIGPYCMLHFSYEPLLEPGKRLLCRLTFEAMTSESIPCARDLTMKR